MEISFVPVQERDIPALAALAREVFGGYFTPIIGAEQVEYMLKKFQSEAALTEQLHTGYAYSFICAEGVPQGYMGVKPENGELFLSKLYLRKSFRGRGIARKAVDFLNEYYARQGIASIWLTVNRHNNSAVAAYQKLGFEITREQKADIGGGFVMDDYIMERAVPAFMHRGAL